MGFFDYARNDTGGESSTIMGFLDFANASLGMTWEELIKKPKATDRCGLPHCRSERAGQHLQGGAVPADN